MKPQEKIKLLFEQNKDLKPSALAKVLGTTQSTIDGWTKQNKCPSAELVPDICNFFNITYDVFYDTFESVEAETIYNAEWREDWKEDYVNSKNDADKLKMFKTRGVPKDLEYDYNKLLKREKKPIQLSGNELELLLTYRLLSLEGKHEVDKRLSECKTLYPKEVIQEQAM